LPVRRPTPEELEAAAAANHFHLSAEEMAAYSAIIELSLLSLDRVDALAEPKPSVAYPRLAGHYPRQDENPFGAWAWKCSVPGRSDGPLRGKRVAVKDVVSVAGIPMTQGSAVMQGFVSDVDATVVTRILDAGGEIVGKATCEGFCLSGASNTSVQGPVLNPRDVTRMTGGSSSGCAALLASDACDLALGCDQGGSIREPSSYCGVFGPKPTFGLVPYTGIASIEPSLDHAGPMGRSVADVATLLEAIAGRDEMDPRTAVAPEQVPHYVAALGAGCDKLRVGILQEGFGWPGASEPDVEDVVRSAAWRFEGLGASVSEISIPEHRDSSHVFGAVMNEGGWSTIFRDLGASRGFAGYLDTPQIDFMQAALRDRGEELPHLAKLTILLATHLTNQSNGHYYAKGQNLRRELRRAYERALGSVDVIVMPTVPQKAMPFDPSRSLYDELILSGSMNQNTAPFDLSGHPALSVPCGFVDGLPIGMMLVGRHWDEARILAAAASFETLGLGKNSGGK